MVLIQYLRVNRFAPLYTLIWQGGFFLFGVLMVLGINVFLNDDPTYACMGSLFALIATAVGVLARGNTTGHIRFRLAVSMGQTRRSFLLCDPLISLLSGALGLLAAWCLYQAEQGLYSMVYPNFTNEIPLDVVYQLKYIVPILAGLVVLDLVFGAILLRFGMKPLAAVWFAFCLSVMILPRAVHSYQDGGTSLFARIGGGLMWLVTGLTPAMWAALGGAALLALVVFALAVYSRAEARL